VSQGFFDANRNRAFPLVTGTAGMPQSGPLGLRNLPDGVIVDCGFLVGAQARFDPAAHSIRLSRVERFGGTFVLSFASDCPGLAGVRLSFTRAFPGEMYAVEHADSGQDYGSESLSLSGSASLSRSRADAGTHCDQPLWYGYLVTGDPAALDSFLSGDGAVGGDPGDAVVEPALVQSLRDAAVTALATGNADRSRVTAAEGDPEPTWPYPTGHVFVNATCLTGEVVFVAGYNATVRQAARDNSVTIGASAGAGAGEPCGEVPLFDGEVPPAGSGLLSGGLRCNEVLRSVNGAGGPLLRLIAGPGVVVTPVPDEHRLVVTVDMSGMATCFASAQA
jgi:hypothetical protein